MAIITISRGSASGGLLLANALGEKLGYDIVGREEILKNAAQFGAPEEELKEALLKPPSLAARLTHTRWRYLTFVQLALCQRIQSDRVIYHGNAGHLLLRGIPHLFRVRLIASIPFRVEQVMKEQQITQEKALEYIEKIDRDRESWTRFIYGLNYLDPHLYDLVINLVNLTVDGAADMVSTAIQRPEFSTTAEARQALDDLLLASKVKAALATNEATDSTEVDAKAKNGEVILSGRLRSGKLVDSVLDVVGGVEGIKSINRDNLDAPDYTI